MTLNPALQSWLEYQRSQRQAFFTELKKLREYTEGTQAARLNEDQKALFPDGKDPEHAVNICPIILTAKCDRLRIQMIDISDDNADDEQQQENIEDEQQQDIGETLTKLVRRWWDKSRMDAVANNVHYATSRDADGYLVAEYSDGKPKLVMNKSYDGESGVEVVYDEGDVNKPLYATKRWNVVDPYQPTTNTIRRMNVYYPNRIEKYINADGQGTFSDANWMPYTGDGAQLVTVTPETGKTYQAAVTWWTDGFEQVTDENGDVIVNDQNTIMERTAQNGMPLGIPVFHFRNNANGEAYGVSDLSEVVIGGLQDSLNDASVDLRMACKLAGVPLNWIAGLRARGEGEGTFSFSPGAVITLGENGSAGQLAPANLTQLIEAEDMAFREIATVSRTPLPMINPSAQVAAEGTLQQQEAPLIARVEDAQRNYGNSYEDAVRMMLKMEAVFGSEVGLSLEQIDELTINCTWEPAQVRNEKAEAEYAKMLMDMGVPKEIVWKKAGLSADEITEAKALLKEQQDSQDTVLDQTLANIASALAGGQNAGQQDGSAGIGGAESIDPNAAAEGASSVIPNGIDNRPANAE